MSELFATHQFDTVVNLGAQAGVRYSIENPNAYIDSNVVGFVNILEGCRSPRYQALDLRQFELRIWYEYQAAF